MLPLNYAILKMFEKEQEPLCVQDVMNRLNDDYKGFRAFKEPYVTEALMSGEKNGLLDEVRIELGEDKKLAVYYLANDTGRAVIKKYIKG